MEYLYLDNNATTRPAPEVVRAMDEVHRELWANPSSVHRFGQAVRQKIVLARQAVAALIGAPNPREVIFTSGGTESDNLALGGLRPGLVISSVTEHSAVREPVAAMGESGVRTMPVEVDINGLIDPRKLAGLLEHAAEHDCTVVSIQWANNETGVIQPIDELAHVVRAAREKLRGVGGKGKIYLHVDATQAVGKLAVNVAESGIDMLTLSAHKFHGPKGVGALWVRRGVRLEPMQRGGPQERELRGGTENTAGIVGMGVAAELAGTFLADESAIASCRARRDRFEQAVTAAVPSAHVHCRDAPRLWNTTNIAFPGLEAEAILLGLSERGVCASAGAACSSGSLEPSPVLLAMGVPEPVAHGSVRFSISRQTTDDEIEQASGVVARVVERLGRTLPTSV